MDNIEFFKVHASGNDFIFIDGVRFPNIDYTTFAQKFCPRQGIGADGVLVREIKKKGIQMRIFNADGSEAEMCGNGARAFSLWIVVFAKGKIHNFSGDFKVNFSTQAGMIKGVVSNIRVDSLPILGERVVKGISLPISADVRIKMVPPGEIKLLIPLKIMGKIKKVNFVNTGVPHTVLLVDKVDKLDVVKLGRAIRYHDNFYPQGTNVDFVEIVNDSLIKIRTYERGVEAETFSCGTGAVASAIVGWFTTQGSFRDGKKVIQVLVPSGEILTVYFTIRKEKIFNVWLQGQAHIVYYGQIGKVRF